MPDSSRPRIIALAGGIGSGKSTVAAILASLGCAVSDSDAEARAVLLTPAVRDELVSWWGRAILTPAGEVDRRAVASRVFADPGERRRLEGLTHPLIAQRRDAAIAAAAAEGRPAVVVDAPLFFEAGLERTADAIIFVDAPLADRLARVRAARGWDEAELARREAAQLPLEEKRRRSTHSVKNTGDRADLQRQVQRALAAILA